MASVVIDLETVGLPVDQFDSSELAYLARGEDTPGESLTKLALSPLTGRIVCIGMVNPDTGGASTLALGSGPVGLATWFADDEAAMLGQFWQKIKPYAVVVTFNGRRFDVPYLLHRSAILGVPASRFDLLAYRYANKPHCDLLDQLTWYGAMKAYSLDFFCRRYHIRSPKEKANGAQVGEMFAAGEFDRIAEYCADDVRATAELYKLWVQRLKSDR